MKALVFLVALATVGCGDDGKEIACTGNVATAMSNAAGTVVITGSLSEGQPILEVIDQNGDHMDHPATDYNDGMATFTGIPSGALTVHWILSCFNDGGQATITGPMMVTVQ